MNNHPMMTSTTTQLKSTPLHDTHEALGARMVDFSGWHMPVQYSKVIDEHMAVRKAAGLFDVSHMGLVTLSSPDVETTRKELNRLVPQDLTKLYPGKAVYTQFLNDEGGIIDDIIVTMLPELPAPFDGFTQFMIVVNAGNRETDLEWLTEQLPDTINVTLHSDSFSLFALQGPKFKDVLAGSGLADVLTNDETLPKRFHILPATIGRTPVLLSRTGYTGEDGVEIVVANTETTALWNTILAQDSTGILPVGLAARDTLRLEAAYPLHGHDISEEDTPLEAGLGWSVKLDQEADFIGKQALLDQKEHGLPKRCVCFKLNQKAISRQHDPVFQDGEPVGEVTSGSISPMLNEPIGMAFISSDARYKEGDAIELGVRNKKISGTIVKRPFYKPSSH